MRMEDAEYHVYEVVDVKPHDKHDGKQTVRVSSGLAGFTADAGTYEEGDLVAVAMEDEWRAVGKVYIE